MSRAADRLRDANLAGPGANQAIPANRMTSPDRDPFVRPTMRGPAVFLLPPRHALMMAGARLRKGFFANAQNDTRGAQPVILNEVKNL